MSMRTILKSRVVSFIFFSLALLTLALGAWGYFALYSNESSGLELYLNVIYSTVDLISGGGSVDEPGLLMAIVRFMAMLVSAAAIIWAVMVFLKWRIRQWWVLQKPWPFRALDKRRHIVICGLGEFGYTLAKSLLKADERVIAIEADSTNPNVERLRKQGGVVLDGDATEEETLIKAALGRASNLVMLTGNDATNLEILNLVKGKFRNKSLNCQIHVHIYNQENRIPFDIDGEYFPPVYDRVEMSLVNVFESAAQELFQKSILGINADTVTQGAEPVRLLLNGFGRMGEAVLIEAMLIGHFCNHVPIEITILDDDAETREQDFFRRHWEVSKHLGERGLRLWKLEFVESIESNEVLRTYTDILACHDSEEEALVAIHHLWDRRRTQEKGRATRFFVHSPSGRRLTNKSIVPFGSRQDICCKKFIIDEESEKVARRSHLIYAAKELKTSAESSAKVKDIYARYAGHKSEKALIKALTEHDIQAAQASKLLWENLSLYKKASNKAEKRHIPIKLRALGLEICEQHDDVGRVLPEAPQNLPYVNELKGDIGTLELFVHTILEATGLNQAELEKRFNALAESEHTRWNAFHVLSNWCHGDKKDEVLRRHDCLISWQEMKTDKEAKLVYDYKNVYQILDVLHAVDKSVCRLPRPEGN